MSQPEFKPVLSSIPDKPGIYQFIDAAGVIIYIGKAKNLKKRVASYFSKNQSGKTSSLSEKQQISGILLWKMNQMHFYLRIT